MIGKIILNKNDYVYFLQRNAIIELRLTSNKISRINITKWYVGAIAYIIQ